MFRRSRALNNCRRSRGSGNPAVASRADEPRGRGASTLLLDSRFRGNDEFQEDSSTPISRTEGFLLLEALIGLVIIGVVAIALLAATAAQVRGAAKAESLLTAAALAQDRLAAIHILNHQGLTNPPDSLLAGTFPPPFEDFSWVASVEPAGDEYDLFAARVEVVGRGERYPVETLLHRASTVIAAGGGAGR